jgi:hypothetical protein
MLNRRRRTVLRRCPHKACWWLWIREVHYDPGIERCGNAQDDQG